MKKVFLTLAILVMAICISAQTNQYFWYQGNLMMGTQITQIDSVTFGEDEMTDTLHILLPRTIIKTVKVPVHDTIYITIHDTVCSEEITLESGILPGVFSVSETKQVHFSSGNLQYNAALGTHQCTDGTTKQGTWRFAEQQYEYIGKDNENRSATYSGWIDLFGWGTSGFNDKHPYMDSYNYSDYGNKRNDIYESYYDWGLYNEISNDGSHMGQWYTMNKDEWEYLLKNRQNAQYLTCFAKIDTINGRLLFPDDWSNSNSSILFNYTGTYSDNTLTVSEWKTLENLGVVFLPATGRLEDGAIYSSQSKPTHYNKNGVIYWSTTHYSSHSAYGLAGDNISNVGWRYYGTPVRLVIPVE